MRAWRGKSITLADGIVVPTDAAFEFRQLGRQLLVAQRQVAQLDERPDDEDADLEGLRGIEDRRGHDGPVFGAGVRPSPKAHFGCGIGGRNLRSPILELLLEYLWPTASGSVGLPA